MSELRQNMATKEWVIIASERAKRPEDFSRKERTGRCNPPHVAACPFCPGNEDKTTAQTYAVMRNDQWQVRIFPNKYPAVKLDEGLEHRFDGMHRMMTGHGMHEVIAESPLHNVSLATMPREDVLEVLRAYRHLYGMAAQNPSLAQIVLFKNHGPEAGTSLEHPHSQMVAVPVVPGEIRQRVSSAMRYHDDHGTCAYCDMLRNELETQKRVVIASSYFVAFVLFAAFTPFHIWLMPRRHASSFGEITDDELEDLSRVLRRLLAKLHKGLSDPDYNLAVRSAPTELHSISYYHWYVTITVRLTKTAGFELGSGMFINVSVPEDSAAFLRQVEV